MAELSGNECKVKKQVLAKELKKLKRDFGSKENRKILRQKGINDIGFSKNKNLFMVQAIYYTQTLEVTEVF